MYVMFRLFFEPKVMISRDAKIKETPKSNRPSDFSQKNCSKSFGPDFGMAPKRPAVYLKTFGWPMVTVARDDFEAPKEDK